MPFERLDGVELDQSLASLKDSIEDRFSQLEGAFQRLESSDRRLKALPRMPLSSLSAMYEFATVQALRALHLAEGAALLIEHENWPACFPVLRSLFECWIALTYTDVMLRKLVLDGERWQRFDTIATRLLRGRSSDESVPIIYVGHMIDEVKQSIGDSQGAAQFVEEVYSELSDGTHPTLWALAYHMEPRSDGLGMTWHRGAREGGMGGPLFDLNSFLGLILHALGQLHATADRVWEAFRAGPAADRRLREQAIQALRGVLERPPELPQTQLGALTERAESLVEHLGAVESRERQEELGDGPA